MRRLFQLAALLLLFSPALHATNAPVLFFSDLVSGPASGNSDTTYSATGGVYVTLYGNFLDTPTAVKLNGSSCLTTVSAPAAWQWYERMVVKLGTSCTTGNFTVTTAGGTSNGIAFTVRSGNIYYVSTTGSDGAAGSFSAPWATLLHARATISAGDTIYGENGTSATADDGSGYSTCMLMDANAGTSGNPKALIAYPGATVTIGSNTACSIGVRSKGDQNNQYWTFAELALLGVQTAINPYSDHDWSLVGNDMTCPNGNSQSGCLDIGGDQNGTEYNYWVYGNNIHNAATNNSPGSVTALYHGVYLSQQIHAIQFGWNTVAYVYGGRCIQENVNNNSSTDDQSSYDMHIHDNLIHDCQLDGIVMTTINPSLGTVELYNNVVYNAGQGPANAEGSGVWTCFDIQGWQNADVGGTESGIADIYNNTFYACGTYATPPYNLSNGGFQWEDGNNTSKGVLYQNNITYLTTGPSGGYFYILNNGGRSGAFAGSNNIFYGIGSSLTPAGCGSGCVNSLTSSTFSDPLFTNGSGDVFTLQSMSPAIGAGTSSAPVPTYDYQGLTRASPPAIGAYEYSAGAGSPAVSFSPNPITFGSVNVGSSSSPTTVTITNTGSANLTFGAAAITSSNSSEFPVGSDMCSSQTVTPSSTCTFTVTFSPSGTGSRTSTITATGNASGTDAASGTGTTTSTVGGGMSGGAKLSGGAIVQ